MVNGLGGDPGFFCCLDLDPGVCSYPPGCFVSLFYLTPGWYCTPGSSLLIFHIFFTDCQQYWRVVTGNGQVICRCRYTLSWISSWRDDDFFLALEPVYGFRIKSRMIEEYCRYPGVYSLLCHKYVTVVLFLRI